MSNPYTSQSISGYNASPPSDDGAETAANVVKWSNHKTKLADPIKTLAEAINTQLITAFGLTFGKTKLSKSADYTVAASDRGSCLSVSGTTTITLPAVATAGVGFPLLVMNTSTGVVTVDGNSSETINGATSIVLWPDDFVLLTCDGSTWIGAGRFAEAGSFTPTWSGFSSDPAGDFTYVKRGNHVWLKPPVANGTSNATGLSVTNLPAAITPATGNKTVPMVGMVNNGAGVNGSVTINTSGNTLTFSNGAAGAAGWTGSGSKGFANSDGDEPVIHYPLRIQ